MNRYIAILLLACAAFAGCDMSDKPALPGKTGGAATAPWPPPVPEGTRVELAANLLAKNYYVLLDGSGSMIEHHCSGDRSKTEVAKEAIRKFGQMVPADANLGLFAFDQSGITERVPLGIDNREQFYVALEKVGADSGTPLSTAIARARDALIAQAERQLGYGEYHLVIVTDGEANSGYDPTDVVNEIVAKTPIVIHTIGFCIGERHSLNQPGKIFYTDAQSPEDLRRALQNVLAESEISDH